jgi:uncharacterized protein (UPF0332 family)
MSIEKLFNEGYLKIIPRSPERVKKSLNVSERYLSEAKKSLKVEAYEVSIMGAYSSIFHSARAILFNDGVSERSHFAIYEYLKEKHKLLGIGYVNSFNLYRKLRHSVAYGLDSVVGKDDAKGAIDFAEEFLGRVRTYLKL